MSLVSMASVSLYTNECRAMFVKQVDHMKPLQYLQQKRQTLHHMLVRFYKIHAIE